MSTPSKAPTAEARVPDRFSRASKVMGIVARDPIVFRSVVDAFEAGDAKLWKHLLSDLRVDDDCDVICRWFRSKETVLECLEVCGPPLQPVTVEQVVRFADVVARLSQDEFMMRRLVDAVQDRDSVAFKTVAAELEAENLCHLLCHWVSVVRYRLICEVVCGEEDVETDQVVAELARAGAAVGLLAKKSVSLRSAVSAAIASDVDSLSSIIGGFVDCQWICEWFCSWRCVWICLPFCQAFPIPEIKDPVEEMRQFALFSARLAENKDAFPRLLAAFQSGDSKAFGALVTEFKAEAYCMQLCHWLCFEICSRWCIVICPPLKPVPYFTQIGKYQYASQINSQLGSVSTPENGLTNVAVSGGGDAGMAFAGTLRLNGVLTEQFGGQPLEYCFQYVLTDQYGSPIGSWTQVPLGWIAPTQIGTTEVEVSAFPLIVLTEAVMAVAPGTAPQPFEIYADSTPDGWIQVPQDGVAPLPSGTVLSLNGNLVNLISSMLPGFSAANNVDESTLTAGSAATLATALNPGSASNPGQIWYGLKMLVRQHGSSTSTVAGTCVHVAINDTTFTNIKQHPEWDGGTVNLPYGVATVDILELESDGCGDLEDSLTVEFTGASPNLGSVGLSMKGNGGSSFPFIVPAAPSPGNDYGTATPSGWSIGTLPPCAYTVTLDVTLQLTDGDGDTPGPLYDQISFCTKAKPVTGTTTAGTTDVLLNDSSASWIPGQFVGYYLAYTSGPAVGLAAIIIANTATTITTAAFSPAPDSSGDSYEIIPPPS